MSRTTKPCPGCGHVKPSRKADEVCYDCRKKLDRVDEVEAELARVRATVDNTLLIRTEPFGMYFPHRFHYGHQRVDSELPEYRPFRLALGELLRVIAAPLDRGRRQPKDHYRRNWLFEGPRYVCDEGSADHLGTIEAPGSAHLAGRAFVDAFKKLNCAVFAAGVEYGQNLLNRLAAGEVTIGQMNDAVTEATTPRR